MNARPSVSSSAYSRSPPTGSPLARRDTRTAGGQEVGDVERRRLAGHRRVGGNDDFVDAVRDAFEQLGHVQIGGIDPVERRQRPAEHVVQAAVLARALDRDDVGRLLDHADERRVTARVGADRAQVAFCQVEALPAEADLLLDVDDGRRQGEDLLGLDLQNVKREPLCGAGADAGELGQLRDQALNRR